MEMNLFNYNQAAEVPFLAYQYRYLSHPTKNSFTIYVIEEIFAVNH